MDYLLVFIGGIIVACLMIFGGMVMGKWVISLENEEIKPDLPGKAQFLEAINSREKWENAKGLKELIDE